MITHEDVRVRPRHRRRRAHLVGHEMSVEAPQTEEKVASVVDALAYTPEELEHLNGLGVEEEHGSTPPPDLPEEPEPDDHGDNRPRSNLAIAIACAYILAGAYTVYVGVQVIRAELKRSN